MQPAALTEFGHLTETFAVNELMKQAGWAQNSVSFAHFRSGDTHEVDLIVEAADGRVAAIEIKAGSKVTDADFAACECFVTSSVPISSAAFVVDLTRATTALTRMLESFRVQQ